MKTLNKIGKHSKGTYAKLLKSKFPHYATFHTWLIRVLYALQNDPSDRIEIEINDTDEPTKISITIYPTYGS